MLTYGDQRYQLTLGPKRTTVRLDNTLSILLSLQLGHAPATPQAHHAVRQWLQARLDQYQDYDRCRTSEWLQNEVVCALIPRELNDRYGDWLCATPDKHVATAPAAASPPAGAHSGTATGSDNALANWQKTR